MDKEKLTKLYNSILQAPVTYLLVLINIIVFVVCEINGDTTDGDYMLEAGAMCPYMVIHYGQSYRLFTCLFLHFGIEHLFYNMLLLFVLGQIFEKAVGLTRFVAIYFASGLSGSFLSFLFLELSGQVYNIAAGASGAIFGVAGGMLVVILVHKGKYAGITTRRMLLMVVVTLLCGFTTAGTDNIGHIGGVLMGSILTFLCYGIPVLIEFRREKQYTLDKSIEDEGE